MSAVFDFDRRAAEAYPLFMSAALEELRSKLGHLSKAEQAQLVAWALIESADAVPGIEATPGVCGGSARVVRTRIPVWTLEVARRQGMSEGEILMAFPSLRAEDLVHAWAYSRAHAEEIARDIQANEEV